MTTHSVIAATVAMRRGCPAKQIAGSEHCDDRFVSLFGNNGNLHVALLDIENSIRRLSLSEDNLILPICGCGLPPSAAVARNALGSKTGLRSRFITGLP